MSLTIAHKRRTKLAHGEMYHGYGAFTTTAQTVELAVPFKRIESVICMPIGQPATGEVLSCDETIVSDNMARPTGGTITIRRAATTTSGLKFAFIVIGY